ncbi:MAG: hypothetical protein QM811_08060 [Pirellulales bacterium]
MAVDSMVKSLIPAILLGVVFAGVLLFMGLDRAGEGSQRAKKIKPTTLPKLLEKGPGADTHVELTEFTWGKGYVEESIDDESAYWIPIFPKKGDKLNIVALVRTAPKTKIDDLKKLVAQEKLRGVVTQRKQDFDPKLVKKLTDSNKNTSLAKAYKIELDGARRGIVQRGLLHRRDADDADVRRSDGVRGRPLAQQTGRRAATDRVKTIRAGDREGRREDFSPPSTSLPSVLNAYEFGLIRRERKRVSSPCSPPWPLRPPVQNRYRLLPSALILVSSASSSATLSGLAAARFFVSPRSWLRS